MELLLSSWKLKSAAGKRKEGATAEVFLTLTGNIYLDDLKKLFRRPPPFEKLKEVIFKTITIDGSLERFRLELTKKVIGTGELEPVTSMRNVQIDSLKLEYPKVLDAGLIFSPEITFVGYYADNKTMVTEAIPFLGDRIELKITGDAQIDIEDEPSDRISEAVASVQETVQELDETLKEDGVTMTLITPSGEASIGAEKPEDEEKPETAKEDASNDASKDEEPEATDTTPEAEEPLEAVPEAEKDLKATHEKAKEILSEIPPEDTPEDNIFFCPECFKTDGSDIELVPNPLDKKIPFKCPECDYTLKPETYNVEQYENDVLALIAEEKEEAEAIEKAKKEVAEQKEAAENYEEKPEDKDAILPTTEPTKADRIEEQRKAEAEAEIDETPVEDDPTNNLFYCDRCLSETGEVVEMVSNYPNEDAPFICPSCEDILSPNEWNRELWGERGKAELPEDAGLVKPEVKDDPEKNLFHCKNCASESGAAVVMNPTGREDYPFKCPACEQLLNPETFNEELLAKKAEEEEEFEVLDCDLCGATGYADPEEKLGTCVKCDGAGTYQKPIYKIQEAANPTEE